MRGTQVAASKVASADSKQVNCYMGPVVINTDEQNRNELTVLVHDWMPDSKHHHLQEHHHATTGSRRCTGRSSGSGFSRRGSSNTSSESSGDTQEKDHQQHQQQHGMCLSREHSGTRELTSAFAHAARIYGTPEWWGRPDDRVSAG